MDCFEKKDFRNFRKASLEGLSAEESHESAHVFQVVGNHIDAKNEVLPFLVFEPGGDRQTKKAGGGGNIRVAGVGFAVEPRLHQEVIIIPHGVIGSPGG